ncbi:hypothetical protein HY643_04820 [Candidatus Woesearchaeota archaeon]|nr:hypothetical protein [Candidatus Woesearchaeota archaeon]
MVSSLRAALEFLEKFGFFDVILPFLLVFTIIFGILEKTRVFGSEEVDGKKYPRKNINSMVAFVIAFFVIAAKEIVATIQTSLPQVALVLIIIVCFLMLAGSFMADKEFSFEKRKGWVAVLTITVFLTVLTIFFNALGWMDTIYAWSKSETGTLFPSLILLAIVIATIFYVVGTKPKSEGGKEE